MSTLVLEIERSVRTLPVAEQLWLLEQIAGYLRTQVAPNLSPFANQQMEAALTTMAYDPAIQTQLAVIEHEFATAEMDGLAAS